ncbi:anti-sigma factor family protein [Ktedonospora formicarum]|uniref:Putative zinc-finger domain-containing protein n=1 Tax=Ktedonospora formicarum TaxID=2778364 RepID=A0A8J3I122_9CHLR|nr:zf-HC2 domain-containing protein [Ktedonospora formicarum]GHO44835.1 hypothetical protein KSX_29980 [Ktedonospora formicarum]
MAHDERHLTTEEFSAYLDGELPSSEQDRLAQHLRSCSSCQEELHELRQTLTLLKSLPQPALPRSFALSLDFARLPDTPPLYAQVDEDKRKDTRELSTPFPGRSSTRSALRMLSAIAAVIGLFLLGSGFLPLMTPLSVQTTSSSAGYSNAKDNGAKYPNNEMTPYQAQNTQVPQITTRPEQTQQVQGQTLSTGLPSGSLISIQAWDAWAWG